MDDAASRRRAILAALPAPRRRVRAGLLTCAAGALLLSACAASVPQVAADGDPVAPATETDPAYGAYLAGLWADWSQSPEDAARFYRAALDADPQNGTLAARAFHAALLAADWDMAATQGRAALALDEGNSEARLFLSVDAMAKGDWAPAVQLLEAGAFAASDALVGASLLGWAHAAQGDAAAALAALDAPGETATRGLLLSLDRGLVLAMTGDAAAADAALRDAQGAYLLPSLAVREYARHLHRTRRADAGREALLARLAQDPDDRIAAQTLAELDGRDRPPAITAENGAAMSLYGVAAALIGRGLPGRAEVYLLLSHRLDPDFGPTRVQLGRIMAAQGRLDPAEAMIAPAAQDASIGVEARIRLAELEAARGDEARTAQMLDTLWRDSGDENAGRALAQTLTFTERWAEAETVLGALIDARAAQGAAEDWQLLYQRAVARERQGKWEMAEGDFRAAIALNPREANLLNYLGYAMIDRGVNLDEGMGMIQRALTLAPRSGHIVDSLGWAYYRLGDFTEAVTHLERAAAMEPGLADINDHLGDAYWRVGRRLEAHYQWRRALGLDPEPALREALEAKLQSGLPPVVAPVVAPAPAPAIAAAP